MPKRIIHEFDFSSKGSHVALVSKTLQGGAANKRTVLMTKATTPLDIEKAIGDVTVKMPFTEFLRKFFHVFWDDAILLAEMLGFESGLDGEPDFIREEIETKLQSISIAKQANEQDDIEEFTKNLSKEEFLELLLLQKAFEEGYEKAKHKNPSSGKKKGNPLTSKDDDKKETTVSKSETGASVPEEKHVNEEKDTMENLQEILKSEDFKTFLATEIEKAREEERKTVSAELEKAQAQIESLEKARVEVEKAKYVDLVKGYSFVEAEDQEALAVVLMKAAGIEGGDKILAVLEKAREAINDFAEAEHGYTGDGVDVTPVEVSKSNVNKFLDARKAK